MQWQDRLRSAHHHILRVLGVHASVRRGVFGAWHVVPGCGGRRGMAAGRGVTTRDLFHSIQASAPNVCWRGATLLQYVGNEFYRYAFPLFTAKTSRFLIDMCWVPIVFECLNGQDDVSQWSIVFCVFVVHKIQVSIVMPTQINSGSMVIIIIETFIKAHYSLQSWIIMKTFIKPEDQKGHLLLK